MNGPNQARKLARLNGICKGRAKLKINFPSSPPASSLPLHNSQINQDALTMNTDQVDSLLRFMELNMVAFFLEVINKLSLIRPALYLAAWLARRFGRIKYHPSMNGGVNNERKSAPRQDAS